MAVRVGINGFGRIGRLVFRAAMESKRKDVEFVAINDLGTPEANAHLLKYDSVHGTYPGKIQAMKDAIKVDGKKVKVLSERDPANLPWGKLGVDIVMECTGIFTSKEAAGKHLEAGAKKVLVSAPASGADITVVYGVNDKKLRKSHKIISNASCTTNCLVPVAWILDKTVGIKHGFMTTIHSYTGDQPSVDTLHKDLRRARASALSMIPTSTGAARATGLVLPELLGKLDGTSVRVPTANVSLVDLVIEAKKKTDAEAINAAMVKAANGPLKGVLAINDEPLVSSDFNHAPASSTFDVTQTQVLDGTCVRVLSWYDNEWGFSNRMSDTAVALGKLL
ncbi:type I glyceraldehyde-3-phosphate dehydrogenase [Pelagibius marinus]|uniref:type I glyceraldehyde-3-phosphate dehydrogenase n=1 Tax=Pelagibius marinus TaxID=2762760 RepID=UPI001872CA71|nr:type I glyceraldehyde-3-phosphate dehydrogenase [Pelagibius marinus]